MLAALGAGAIGLGILIGRVSSLLVLSLTSPIVWLSSAIALLAGGWSAGPAFLYALGPVVAMQLAYFAGAQMRLDAVPREADEDGPRTGRAPGAAGRRREPGLHPLAADDRKGQA